MSSPTSPASVTRIVRVVNPNGLHARPCHAIVQIAMGFSSTLRIRRFDRPGEPAASDVNGKSILELMTLEASQGIDLELASEGDDAVAMLESLSGLFARGFDEE